MPPSCADEDLMRNRASVVRSRRRGQQQRSLVGDGVTQLVVRLDQMGAGKPCMSVVLVGPACPPPQPHGRLLPAIPVVLPKPTLAGTSYCGFRSEDPIRPSDFRYGVG